MDTTMKALQKTKKKPQTNNFVAHGDAAPKTAGNNVELQFAF